MHKLVYGLVDLLYGLLILLVYGFHDAVLQVFLEKGFAGVVDLCSYRRKLNKHIGAILSVFDHPFDRLQMADGPGKTIDDLLHLSRVMSM